MSPTGGMAIALMGVVLLAQVFRGRMLQRLGVISS